MQERSLLNAGHPRLKIQEFGEADREYASDEPPLFLLAVVLFSAGGMLLIVSLVAQARERQEHSRVSLTEPGPPVHELQFAAGEHLSSSPDTLPRDQGGMLSRSMWLGFALFGIGLTSSAAIVGWMATRTFVAVDMPVSLARGHVGTGPFAINLRDSYQVRIRTDEHREPFRSCPSYNSIKARWLLYQRGRLVASGDECSPNAYLNASLESSTVRRESMSWTWKSSRIRAASTLTIPDC